MWVHYETERRTAIVFSDKGILNMSVRLYRELEKDEFFVVFGDKPKWAASCLLFILFLRGFAPRGALVVIRK
jgi:hypothetical protein